uniref:Uncharacterized protein n=1 Tax=Rhizophora mucronata TaxID=61149 RepID=A0A2P2QY63_RHIMU
MSCAKFRKYIRFSLTVNKIKFTFENVLYFKNNCTQGSKINYKQIKVPSFR